MTQQVKQTVDLRGLTCPDPVIRTKKLFDDPETHCVEALVDDDICVNNLQRLARSLKATCHVVDSGKYFTITLEKPPQAGSAALPARDAGQSLPHAHEISKHAPSKEDTSASGVGTVIFLGKDTFGAGDEEFSKTLLNLFLQTAFESGLHPRAILMANSGVRLMAKNSPALKVLNDFKGNGCEVLACGLCVDYYKLKDDIPKEQITNMFAICEYLFASDKVLQP